MNHNDKTGCLIITGGAKRIGSLLAEYFAGRGWKIILHYNKSEKEAFQVEDKIKKKGGNISLIQKNITNSIAAKEVIEFTIEESTACGKQKSIALINNASAFMFDTAKDMTEDFLDMHMHANFKIPTLLIKELFNFLPKNSSGSVVNMLDAKLFGLNPDHYSYTLSKYALLGLTKVAALAYAPRIRVNGVAPGITLPNPDQSNDDLKKIQGFNPLKIGSKPEDIFSSIKFFLETPSVTGETILIDGGAHMKPLQRDAAFY